MTALTSCANCGGPLPFGRQVICTLVCEQSLRFALNGAQQMSDAATSLVAQRLTEQTDAATATAAAVTAAESAATAAQAVLTAKLAIRASAGLAGEYGQ